MSFTGIVGLSCLVYQIEIGHYGGDCNISDRDDGNINWQGNQNNRGGPDNGRATRGRKAGEGS